MAQVLMVGGGGTDTSGVTAIAGHVLNPDVFVNSDGQEVEGTMVDNSDTDIRLDDLGAGWIPFLTSTTGTGLLVVKIPSTGYYKQWNSSQSTVNRLSWSASNLGNAQAQHVLDTATFTSKYGIKQTGSIPSKAAETKHPVLTNMTDKVNITIASGQYLSGAQVIRGVTISDTWTAANIKSGVKISVGDTSGIEALSVRTGTYTNVSSGQLALVAAALRTGYSGYANGGGEVRGSMTTYTTPTAFTPTQSPITIQVGGKYVSSNLTVNAITYPSTFVAGNVKKGVSIKIGGKEVVGTFEGFVPDALDIYKNGSWGTGYNSSSIIPLKNTTQSSYKATVVFNTANIETYGWCNSTSNQGIAIDSNINLSPYNTFAYTATEYGGTSGTAVPKMSSFTYCMNGLLLETVRPASYSYVQYSISDINKIGTDNSVGFNYASAFNSDIKTGNLLTGYHFRILRSVNYGTAHTTSFDISGVTASRYLYLVSTMNSIYQSGYYRRITHIYFT